MSYKWNVFSVQAQRGNYWLTIDFSQLTCIQWEVAWRHPPPSLLQARILRQFNGKFLLNCYHTISLRAAVTDWNVKVLFSRLGVWWMCNKCVGKKTDVQWQKEKNASANSFMFWFFSSFFFGSYVRNANPQITWTVYCTPRLKYGLPLHCSVHTFSFIAHSACRVMEVPERLPPVPACTQQHQYIRDKREMLRWI